MASIKDFKKQINYTLGDLITECYEKSNVESVKAEAIVDETISIFDSLIEKVNAKDVENKKSHFNSVNEEFKNSVASIQEKIKNL